MSTKKNIYIINIAKDYGGAEKFVENIYYGLENEYKINLVIDQNGKFIKQLKNSKIKNLIILNTKGMHFIKESIRLSKVINKDDIIFTQGVASSLIGIIIKFLSKCKMITTIHSDINFDFSGMKKIVYKYLEKLIVKYADQIITVSDNLKSKITKRHKTNKNIKTIYNGIDVNLCSQNKMKKKNEIKKILIVGRLDKVKNIEFALDILNSVKNKGFKFECLIIGDGGERQNIEGKLLSLGELNENVKIIGFSKEIESHMQNADALLLTSQMEGIPTTILEAFKNELLVISSNVGGIPEMIEDGYNGILYKLGNKEEVVQKVIDFLEEKINYDFIIENAKREFNKKWTIEICCENYKTIFCKI